MDIDIKTDPGYKTAADVEVAYSRDGEAVQVGDRHLVLKVGSMWKVVMTVATGGTIALFTREGDAIAYAQQREYQRYLDWKKAQGGEPPRDLAAENKDLWEEVKRHRAAAAHYEQMLRPAKGIGSLPLTRSGAELLRRVIDFYIAIIGVFGDKHREAQERTLLQRIDDELAIVLAHRWANANGHLQLGDDGKYEWIEQDQTDAQTRVHVEIRMTEEGGAILIPDAQQWHDDTIKAERRGHPLISAVITELFEQHPDKVDSGLLNTEHNAFGPLEMAMNYGHQVRTLSIPRLAKALWQVLQASETWNVGALDHLVADYLQVREQHPELFERGDEIVKEK